MAPQKPLLSARDVMSTELVKVRVDLPIEQAIDLLLDRNVASAPVIDAGGDLVGVLSEKDCLAIVSNGAYHDRRGGTVRDFMTPDPVTVAPWTDVFALASLFRSNPFRKVPVVDEGRLVGVVSRRGALEGIRRMQKADPTLSFPDYRRPA